MIFQFFASCPQSINDLLAAELSELGAESVRQQPAGCYFQGPMEVGYKATLWSRVASRVMLEVARFPASNEDELYKGIDAIPWQDHLDTHGTFAVDFSSRDRAFSHSHYAALKVKDAIVDQFRRETGERPSVDTSDPDVRVQVFAEKGTIHVNLDFSGPLHERGYRLQAVDAPLRETLAAALLLRSNWAEMAKTGAALVDITCGSATLLVEGAWIAMNRAPALSRQRFGFERWLGHVPATWKRLLEEAHAAVRPLNNMILGVDNDTRAIMLANANLERAGLKGKVFLHSGNSTRFDFSALNLGDNGLVITNPPYGERLGDVETLRPLYKALGQALIQHFAGWQAAVFTCSETLAFELGLKATRSNHFRNGQLECQLLRFEVKADRQRQDKGPLTAARFVRFAELAQSEGAQMFANRLRKNLKHLGRWARKNGIGCYRLYDADIPEYAFAIDYYSGDNDQQWLVVQEYAPPASIDENQARTRTREVMVTLPEVTGVAAENIHLKVRMRQKGKQQYEKLIDDKPEFHVVNDGKVKVWVNFTHYLDTGLFLDHLPIRQWIEENAAGKHFLNLYAYTGSATVHAAAGGAATTLTVDMSHTYLDWARRNMQLNGFGGRQHAFEQGDCIKWLEQDDGLYDLIFLDPPSFSTSKRMEGTFDVQRDQVRLIDLAMRGLSKDGTLVFSNNLRSFKLAAELEQRFQIEDITPRTLAEDFRRNPKIHRCWLIRHKA
ncbi:MAG: bifunctional 23S rRNA (guanine(2069)-N(7))-methyltransferase RlmK/23S rRNA (guanine(2445)-N(2))-methyltransferase RlmL [Burkholderiales bacterium]|nr:MAG: bifunctional 23S rRNA (guanine(2069)-N(7))-methyltransferase RlmK/23S rRNA (guanine(2445)-N(2))-methyltransferase RlmL [Burkholderiales bacterium]